MYAVENLLLRASIVLGMVAAVVTILYFTPMPDHFFKSCDRPCHHLDLPMICRVKFVLEVQEPRPGSGECEPTRENCTLATTRGALTANRQIPGPPIHVCQNDILVVDIQNRIAGHSVSFHWRGQSHHEVPAMDGVPMVTQCPISSYTTFQYKFRASNAGTHLWHAHSGAETGDGLFGALVVRQPDRIAPHHGLYDADEHDHTIIVSEWGAEMASNLIGARAGGRVKGVLINGKGEGLTNAYHFFKVKKGKRYRFRLAYSGGPRNCPITFSIEDHYLTIIALDGNYINPLNVTKLTLNKGERADFILNANQHSGKYSMIATSSCEEAVPIMKGLGMIVYYGGPDKKAASQESLTETEFSTNLCESTNVKVCVGVGQPLKNIPEELKGNVDRTIYLGFDSVSSKNKDVYRINNITFTYPSSPLLTQRTDVPETTICNADKLPEHCTKEEICECVHVEQITTDSTVEIILYNKGGIEEETIFHLHGYNFYVVGYREFPKTITESEIKEFHSKELLFQTNLENPILKDTIRIQPNSVVALRFIANHPGYWMLRDEKSHQWSRGMDVVFQIGDYCDIPSKPANFPSCGSFVGPDFFLM